MYAVSGLLTRYFWSKLSFNKAWSAFEIEIQEKNNKINKRIKYVIKRNIR